MKRYKKYFKESRVRDEDEWIEWLSHASRQVYRNTLSYYANIKKDFSLRNRRLDPSEKKDLINFQRALDKMGVTNMKFKSYVTT